MGRSAVSSIVVLLVAMAVVVAGSGVAFAQFDDSQRRSMGNLNPEPSRRSMGNLRPEAPPSQSMQGSGSGTRTVVVPNPTYPGYYYTPQRVYPNYRRYRSPYGYGYDYPYGYYTPGYHYRYYSLPPVVYPSGALFGPAAVQRFMRGY